MALVTIGSKTAPEEQPFVLLVERIRQGDSAAEGELAAIFRQRIFVAAVARVRDREIARDLTQETLMAVIKSLRAGQLREADKLPAFIQGTARNLINNFFRTGQ